MIIISKTIRILNGIFTLLFAVLAYLFIDGYASDMVIVHEVQLYALIIVGLLVLNSVILLIPAITRKIELKKGYTKGKSTYLLIRSIILLIDTGFVLYFGVMIILGIVDGYPWFLLVVVGLVFVGMSILYAIDIIKDLIHLKNRTIRQSDMLFAGFILFLFIGTFGLKYMIYSPEWNAGVEHNPIFSKGDAGAEYRIPSMLVLPGHVIIAFAEQRTEAYLDWGDINLVSRRSVDGGQNWGPLQVVVDNGTRTAGNPCPVYNSLTNTIHLLYNIDNKLVFEKTSSDLGLTWSVPHHLTEELGLDINWNSDRFDYQHGTGPGIGIQMNSGRLIIPSYYFDERGSHVFYSDDNGTTWNKGANLGVGGECQVIELLNNSLYINARSAGGIGRYVATSNNGGVTWAPWKVETQLIDLGCMASLIRYNYSDSFDNDLVFTNPQSTTRAKLTLYHSEDDGETWIEYATLYEGSSAYSQLGQLSDGTICFLAEVGPKDYRDSIQFCTYSMT